MNSIPVSILLLIVTSSIITITVQESNATSKGDKIREGAKDLKKDLEEGLKELEKINNNNQNIKNEFDDSEDTSSENDNNNGKKSTADELRELAKLKEEGIITEEEFAEMKENLIEEKK